MTATSTIRTARLAGLAAGVAIAVTVLLASRPASGGGAVGAVVRADANQTGELAVDPPGPARFIDDSALHTGQRVKGSFRLTNQTGVTEAVRLGALPSAHDLDQLLELRLVSGGETLADGKLGALADPRGPRLLLGPGETATVSATASLPPGVGEEAAAALVDIAVTFDLRPLR
jgi:hypothetical protein